MTEDAASVLEHFINDVVANLPNEIAHIYEEIQAKDKVLLELQKGIQQRDGYIQKFIKQNGSHVHNQKEEAYSNYIRKAYVQINVIQDEKIAFAQKALDLMDRHIKRLDVKIKDLQAEGLFPADPIPLPSHPSAVEQKSFTQVGVTHSRTASRRDSPSIHVRSTSIAMEKSALSNASTPNATSTANGNGIPGAGASSVATVVAGTGSAGSVGTPGSTAGHDLKRRRLVSAAATGTTGGVASGTGTTSTTPAGISTALPNSATTPGPNSAGLSSTGGRGSAEAAAGAGGGAAGTPAASATPETRAAPGLNKRGGAGGAVKHGGAGHKRRVQHHEQEEDEDEEEEDDDDDEENGDDKRLYCYCQQVSWGNMVACDDSDCRYEWFHWGCVNLTKEPPGKWYCDTCRERREKKREK